MLLCSSVFKFFLVYIVILFNSYLICFKRNTIHYSKCIHPLNNIANAPLCQNIFIVLMIFYLLHNNIFVKMPNDPIILRSARLSNAENSIIYYYYYHYLCVWPWCIGCVCVYDLENHQPLRHHRERKLNIILSLLFTFLIQKGCFICWPRCWRCSCRFIDCHFFSWYDWSFS